MPATPALMGPGPWATLEPDVNMTGSKKNITKQGGRAGSYKSMYLKFLYMCLKKTLAHI